MDNPEKHLSFLNIGLKTVRNQRNGTARPARNRPA